MAYLTLITNKARVVAGSIAIAALGVLWWQLRTTPPVVVRGTGREITVAATGDSLVVRSIHLFRSDPGLKDVADVLQGSSLAVTNLEENLLNDPAAAGASSRQIRWPYGTKRTAQDLRRLGFTFISLANNHAIDYGVEGLVQTAAVIAQAGLFHAGTGRDLPQARAPVFAGPPGRSVAMIALATSVTPESRATATHGEILGRPGVNALKYSSDVKVDSQTFATLMQSTVTSPSPKHRANELMMSGRVIEKGPRTEVHFVGDQQDIDEIVSEIRQARKEADMVIVSVHSHEPMNQSTTVPEFLRAFAHQAIDAGANIVVGHGPHQLRGIEVYKGAAIFYSLGNFAFEFHGIDPTTEDAFDAGMDLYRLALGAVSGSESVPPQPMSEPQWWESVIALINFDQGTLQSVHLVPIDLGVELAAEQRGIPRLADPKRGNEIISHLSDLSTPFGTRIQTQNGTGVISLR